MEQIEIFSEEEMRYAVYTHKGEHTGFLNSDLIKQQGITEEGIKRLLDLHKLKSIVFDCMRDTDDVDELHYLADCVEHVEYALQEAWGFPLDRNFHRWWDVPKCSCPELDNRGRYGTEYRIIDCKCPVHGSLE